MDWASLWADIGFGLLIAGAIGAWVPPHFWSGVFLTGHPLAAKIIGPLVGPLIAVVTFVCSVGNVPLAAVLWRGGASFGGVVAFIFADLLVLPILDIYRKYYGWKQAARLTAIFYVAMAAAGYAVEIAFGLLHLAPARSVGSASLPSGVNWNYTTWLDIASLVLAALLFWRFLITGGPKMLRMMSAQPKASRSVESNASGSR